MASSLPPAADNSQASNPPPALNPSTASNTLATAPQNVPKCRAVDNCNTGSDLRKAVSHVFGRNKLCTRLIPDYVWVYFCRKHYQRGRYRNAQEYAKTQCDLVYRQIELVQEWSDRNRQKRDGGIVVQWTVALRKREHVRLQNAFNRQTQGQEVDTKDPAVILGTAVPSWLRSKVGDGYSTHDLLDIVARMKDDVIRLQSTNIPDIELLPDIREAKDLNFENSTPLKRKIDNVVGSTSHHQQTLSPTGAALPVPRTPVFSTNGKAPFRAGLHDSVHLDDEWGYERPEKRQRVSEASRYNECRTYAPPHPPENEHALYDPMHRRTQTETEYTYAMPEYLYPHASAQLHSTHTLPATESLQVLATAAEISPRRHFPAPLSPSTPERAGPSWYNGLNQAPAPRHDSDGSQQDYFGGARYLSSGDATRNRFQSDAQNSQSGHWISSSTLMASPQNYNVEGSGQPMSRSGSDATPRRFDPADILPPIQGLAPQQRALPYAPPNHSSGTVIQGLYQTSLHPTYGYSAKPAARSLDAESPGLAQPSRAYEYNTETQGSQPARID